jgi:hypothetical protein
VAAPRESGGRGRQRHPANAESLEMNVQLSDVLSDLSGASGMAIVNANSF